MPPPDDAEYELFLTLFARHHARVQAYVRSLVPDGGDADDVFQATSLILWRSFGTFDRDRDFLPWALGVARHQVLMFWRRARRDRHCFSDSLLETLADESLHRATEAGDRQRALDACVHDLSPRQQELIRMFYADNLPADAIAAAWDRSVHAVYKSLKVTRKALFDCVKRRLAADGLEAE